MVWSLQKIECEVFQRNAIATVAAELRFQPLLSIEKAGSTVADFQDKVRSRFPTYAEADVNDVTVDGTSVSVRQIRAFEFGDTAGTSKLRLTSGALSLIRSAHKDRQGLIEELLVGVKALYNVFGKVETIRLGILYSNVIDKPQIEKDVGKSCGWKELVRSDYFPQSSSDEGDRLFWTQLWDKIGGNNGELAVRYGLLKQPGDSVEPLFRLDIDRSVSSTTITLDNCESLSLEFTDDIYAMFRSMAGERLIDWMRGTPLNLGV